MTSNTAEALREARLHGWRSGLPNLWRKESRRWWGKGRWLLHTLFWIVLLNGILAARLHLFDTRAQAPTYSESLGILILYIYPLPLLGVIILTQGMLLDERRRGTLAWLLSKPIARSALLLSKFGTVPGMLFSMLVCPTALGCVEVWLATGSFPPLQLIALALPLHICHLLLYFCLSLLLQTLSSSRVVVLSLLALVFLCELATHCFATISGPILQEDVFSSLLVILAIAAGAFLLLGLGFLRFLHEEF